MFGKFHDEQKRNNYFFCYLVSATRMGDFLCAVVVHGKWTMYICIFARMHGECRSWKGSSEAQLLKVLGHLLVHTWHRAFPLLVYWLEDLALVCPGFASDNGTMEELTDECVWKQTQGRRLNFGADEPLSFGVWDCGFPTALWVWAKVQQRKWTNPLSSGTFWAQGRAPENTALGGRARRLGIQGYSWLHSKFKVNLDYMRPSLNKTKQNKNQKPLKKKPQHENTPNSKKPQN